MTFIVSMAKHIAAGPMHRRNLAFLTLACWFTMGAFVTSAVFQYISIGNVPHGVAVTVGGCATVLLGVCLKTV